MRTCSRALYPTSSRSSSVSLRSSCADMPSPSSRRTGRVRPSLASPAMGAFPEMLIGSASASVVFGTCSAFTPLIACQLADRPSRPSKPKASAASLPPRLLRLLPSGLTPAGRPCLCTAHQIKHLHIPDPRSTASPPAETSSRAWTRLEPRYLKHRSGKVRVRFS